MGRRASSGLAGASRPRKPKGPSPRALPEPSGRTPGARARRALTTTARPAKRSGYKTTQRPRQADRVESARQSRAGRRPKQERTKASGDTAAVPTASGDDALGSTHAETGRRGSQRFAQPGERRRAEPPSVSWLGILALAQGQLNNQLSDYSAISYIYDFKLLIINPSVRHLRPQIDFPLTVRQPLLY